MLTVHEKNQCHKDDDSIQINMWMMYHFNHIHTVAYGTGLVFGVHLLSNRSVIHSLFIGACPVKESKHWRKKVKDLMSL